MAPPSTNRVGRPRKNNHARPQIQAREHILEVAAELFIKNGYAATSTRAIAAGVGIRQASLYYYFPSKDDILAELLAISVRPSLQALARLKQVAPSDTPPEVLLFALVLIDVKTLAEGVYNIGSLYNLPEVRAERFDDFWNARQSLQDVYGQLAALVLKQTKASTIDQETMSVLLLQLVEAVIVLRDKPNFNAAVAFDIARSILRLLGLEAKELAQVEQTASRLLAER